MGTPGWNRLAIGGDEVGASSWGGRPVGKNAVGGTSVNQKGEAGALVLKM